MRSGEAGGRRAPSIGITWLLLALACLVLAVPGKAEPHRAGNGSSHAAVHAPVAERASLAASVGDIATAVPATDDGGPETLPILSEPSAEQEPSGDKYRRSHGAGFPALAGLAQVVPAATVTGHRRTSNEGRLPPAHAPPATC